MKQELNAGHWAQRAVMRVVASAIIIVSLVSCAQTGSTKNDDTAKRSKQSFTLNWGDDDVTIIKIDSVGSLITTSKSTYKINHIIDMMGIEGDVISKEEITEAILNMQDIFVNKEARYVPISKVLPVEETAEDRMGGEEEQEIKVERVYLFPKDCQLIKFYEPEKYREMYYTFVIRHKEYTQVDVVTNVRWDWHWIGLNGTAYLLNSKNGDRYMLHSTMGDYPIDKTIVFRELKGKTTVITRIFPPLDEGVKVVTLVDVDNPNVAFPENAMTESPHNWNLKVYDRVEDLPYHLEVEGKVVTLDADFELPKNDSKLYR